MNRKHERRGIVQTERKIELKPEQKENKSNYNTVLHRIKREHKKSLSNEFKRFIPFLSTTCAREALTHFRQPAIIWVSYCVFLETWTKKRQTTCVLKLIDLDRLMESNSYGQQID